MTPTYFKLKTVPTPQAELLNTYGQFNPDEMMEEKDRGDPDKVSKAKANYERGMSTAWLTSPAHGHIAAICYLNPDDSTVAEETRAGSMDEKRLLEDFWRRYTASGGFMSGWDIFDDMNWIKVRSWALNVPLPLRAFRSGPGRPSWVGFTDIKREFTGGPHKDADFSQVSKAFGYEGEQAPKETFARMWTSGDPAERAKAVALLEADVRVAAMLSGRMGLDVHEGSNPHAEGIPEEVWGLFANPGEGPITFDVETAPGELGDLKHICGDFDERNVKTGNLKDPQKIRDKIAGARDSYDSDLLRNSMLDPLLGRTAAIGYRLPNGKVIIPEGLSEKQNMELFWRVYENHPGYLQGWNIFDFDNDWIKVRSWMLGVPIPAKALRRPGAGYQQWRKFTDLEVVFTGDPRAYCKLDTASKFFGHDGKNGHGEDFWKFWESSDPALHQKGYSYLANDVILEGQVGHDLGMDAVDPSIGIPEENRPKVDIEELERQLMRDSPGPEVAA